MFVTMAMFQSRDTWGKTLTHTISARFSGTRVSDGTALCEAHLEKVDAVITTLKAFLRNHRLLNTKGGIKVTDHLKQLFPGYEDKRDGNKQWRRLVKTCYRFYVTKERFISFTPVRLPDQAELTLTRTNTEL